MYLEEFHIKEDKDGWLLKFFFLLIFLRVGRNALRPTILATNLCFLKLFGRLRYANRPYKIIIFLWMEGFNKTPSEFFYGWKGLIKHHLNNFK